MKAEPGLSAAARLGPYFVWESWDGDPAWRPFADLFRGDVIAERVGAARRTLVRMTGLGADEIGEREVASITFLGYASRLVSPPLGALAAGGGVPVPDPARMWWRPVPGGPLPIACDALTAIDCTGRGAAGLAAAMTATIALVESMLAAFARDYSLPEHLLWGNVASALGGAAGMIADNAPGHAARAAAVVEEMLRRSPLAGTASLERPDPARDRWFLVRRNCCLYYRIPGGGTCGDCVLTPEDDRRRGWERVLSR